MNCAKFIWAAVCTLLLQAAVAQTTALTGYVYDSQTRQPLSGATIRDASGKHLKNTDNRGFFTTPVLARNEIRVTLVGYKEQTVIFRTSGPLNIQMEADPISLTEVRVDGFSDFKKIRETAGSVALLTTDDISRGNAASLQTAFNTVPGIRMDQSTLSEARISIRGNGVRSAFGIRNVKIYVNDIPLTEADGTSRIEALDVNSVGRVEIIKGPASSVYGAGTGGVINFSLQRSPYQEQSIEASGLTGRYGLNRLATNYRSGGDNLNTFLSVGWQEYQGYRAHSKDLRRFITGNFQLFPDNKRIITLLVNRTTQHAQIPGSLTHEQSALQPQQANPGNIDKQAARYQNWTRIGIGQQYRFNEKFTNHTSVFSYFYDLDHPLPFAYIRNHYQSYGGRTRFGFDPGFAILPTTFTAGMEFNQGLTKGTQYVNNKGAEGPLMTNADYRNTLYSLFYQSETALGNKTTLVLGASYNGLNYDVKDLLNPARSGVKKFKGQVSPRVALSHSIADNLSIQGSISSGFSPPTTSEVRNADGTINRNLQAEKGTNYELNFKGSLAKSRLSFDVALFSQHMEGELIGQTVQQGITVYNNSGKTRHNGVEVAIAWQIASDNSSTFAFVKPFVAATFSDFKFTDYKIRNATGQISAIYDENPLTGISPWVVNAGLDLQTRQGLYVFTNLFYSDRQPLNDASTAFNPSYRFLNIKLGYKKTISRRLDTEIYTGIDNLFDESYSSIVSLNAASFSTAGPAYFNPAAKRNGYAGLSLKYKFKSND